MPKEIASRFVPAEIEARWQSAWERSGCFRAPDGPTGATFSMVLPPPNVTGVLTLGHMLGDTVMDVLARHRRMQGRSVLWLPGVDHAGLATQVAVRRHLAKSKVRLEDLTKTEVLREIEAWKADRESTIREQTRTGGFSVDWSRYRYTMDPGSVRATRTVFVRLYEEGLIYRGERIVNWDPRLRTAISDLEVVHREEEADLLFVRYPWADGSPGGLVVATVRPETIFGDTAVAVHPEDARHQGEVGRSVRVPLTDRVVPVIADASIDPEFGNGALKVTPQHDVLDHEIAKRHPEVEIPPSVLDESAHLVGERVPAEFRGLDREKARTAVTAALAEGGFVVRSERYRHSVARSERSDEVIEPRLSTQWFVKIAALAPPVVEAVRTGEIRIHPERWTLTFFRWMEHLEDWCISRQVSWGHPIPVSYCEACSTEVVSLDAPGRCPRCGGTRFRPDPDVLDTWFTSWLWPFVTLGWPEPTSDLERYYPTDVLVTGRDIMFFWVARMMMAGYRFTGRRPFSHVYFTGMLRDDTGRKMSKHLGNSPEPLDLIRDRGADALRFALVYPNPVDQDGPFTRTTLDGGRNFLTKVWNLGRFLLGNLPDGSEPPRGPPPLDGSSALENRWILSRWRENAASVDEALEGFEFTAAATLLYGFVWHDLADRYVEMAKDALQGERGELARREAREVLLFVFERSLRQLHPFVPHVTEELWHALPHDGELLALAAWPTPGEAPLDRPATEEMDVVLEGIRAIRNLRTEAGTPAPDLPGALVRPSDPAAGTVLRTHAPILARLGRIASLRFLEAGASAPRGFASSVTTHAEYFLESSSEAVAGPVGLTKEREKLTDLFEKTRARLADPGFRSRAPAHVVAEAEEKASELAERIRKIDENLARAASGAS
ncbi:MAG TPA: valine--tRNA ligase [Thermoplasmata archaeon]|nr:valine--tRNA ligase [Thermoplasmata archaeon]